MREAFITKIVDGFCRFYDYGVIELNTSGELASGWALVKNLSVSSKRVIIFINGTESSDCEDLNSKLKHMLGCDSLQLIRILALDESAFNSNVQQIHGDDIITIDFTSSKLLAYGYKCEEAAQELVNLINYYNGNSRESSKEKPWITYGLIAVNVLMYVITAFLSGNPFDSNANVLVFLGAKYNELIAAGQYYRLITCMFLHGGILHLVLNMYSLYSIGPFVERIYGRLKYLIIYFVSGILASFASFVFSEGLSVGASGAIFGLLGTTLVFAIAMRKGIGKGFLRNIASVIIINLFIGFSLPNIDNFAHFGGLVGGVVTALIFNITRKK